jgi:hypothetical protein
MAGSNTVSLMTSMGLTKKEIYRAWLSYLRCCSVGKNLEESITLVRVQPELNPKIIEYFAILGLNLFKDCFRDVQEEGKYASIVGK